MDEIIKINIEELKKVREANKENYENQIREEATRVANDIIKQVCDDFSSYKGYQGYTTVCVRVNKDANKDEDAVKHRGRVTGISWALIEFKKVGWKVEDRGTYVDSEGKYHSISVYFE